MLKKKTIQRSRNTRKQAINKVSNQGIMTLCYFTQPSVMTVHGKKIHTGVEINLQPHQSLYNLKVDIWNVLKKNNLHHDIKKISDIVIKVGGIKWEDFETPIARSDTLQKKAYYLDIYFKNQ